MTDPIFVITAPTSAFLGSWRWDRPVTLSPGTYLRYWKAGGYGDACSAIYMDWDELVPLDGEWAGEVVSVLDAGTPLGPDGEGHHWGPRPRLGLPASVSPVEPLPPEWRWRVVP